MQESINKIKEIKFDTSNNIKDYHNKLRKVSKFGNYINEPMYYANVLQILNSLSKNNIEVSNMRDGSGSFVIIFEKFEMLFLCDKETKLFFPFVGIKNKY